MLFLAGFIIHSNAQVPPVNPANPAHPFSHIMMNGNSNEMSPDTMLKRYDDSIRMKQQVGDYEGMYKYCDLRIRKTPFRLQYMYYERAQAETYLAKYDNAVRDYDTVIGLDSSAAEAYMDQAYIYMQLHQTDKALKDYERGLKADKDSGMKSAIYLSRGNAYLSQKNQKDAEADFTNALKYNRNSWQAYLQRGSIKRFAKDYKNAQKDLNEAYRLKPTDPDVLLLRGIVFFEENMYRECAADLKEALKVRKTSDTYFYLGMSEEKIGNDSLAREYLTKVLETDPNNGFVLNTRGKINFDMKHFDLAINDYSRVIKLKPKSGEAYANRAYVYSHIGDRDKACSDLHKAASLGVKKAAEAAKKYCGN